MNQELPDVQTEFRKGRGARDQIANICWIMEKSRDFQKGIYFCSIDYNKAFDCMDVRVGLWRRLHTEELMLLNCGLEKTLESPLDSKEIQPVNPKTNQSWTFIGRTDAEVETPILWPSDVKNWLIGKDPDAGKDWRREEEGMMEDEMVGWLHQLHGHESEWTPGDGDGQEAWCPAVFGVAKS